MPTVSNRAGSVASGSQVYDRRSVEEARRDLAAWTAKWEARYPRSVA